MKKSDGIFACKIEFKLCVPLVFKVMISHNSLQNSKVCVQKCRRGTTFKDFTNSQLGNIQAKKKGSFHYLPFSDTLKGHVL